MSYNKNILFDINENKKVKKKKRKKNYIYIERLRTHMKV